MKKKSLKKQFPFVSLILMLIYLIGGSLLIAVTGLPRVFGGIDIATLVIGYLGYLFLIGACLFYVKTGK
ncbi:MAG: hypothetical protein HFF17_10405 [Oscillospiraceae bacterium]|nr:hypothetical protein [Oscillospiraceae bacterium]MCI9143142.1 hypothetical protein [Lachnospiraceae bacterium]